MLTAALNLQSADVSVASDKHKAAAHKIKKSEGGETPSVAQKPQVFSRHCQVPWLLPTFMLTGVAGLDKHNVDASCLVGSGMLPTSDGDFFGGGGVGGGSWSSLAFSD